VPSTLVHVAVAGLVGTALLADVDRRSIAVVLAAAAVPDLDAFVGPFVAGAHRAVGHTFLLPAALAVGLALDARTGDLLRARYGDRGVRVAWVALVALFVGGILPDLFTNGVNVFYPVHDTFYRVNGELLVSNQRGVVQTFVELGGDGVGTTETVHYSTGVDPTPGGESGDVERRFFLVQSGFELLTVLLGGGLVVVRLVVDGN
jgi:membrane-bound metal-dependent hydrolase YbcI (DUF457 family)